MTVTMERRSLKMHDKLLADVISRQAGSFSKGVVELVQNSADAKAKQIKLLLSSSQLVAADDGRGFKSEDEIDKWFGTFGQPHDESEQKIFGNFRMGRGQAFAFGRNVWRTSTFSMDVDIKNKGLTYALTTDLPYHAGCHITLDLYSSMDAYDLRSCTQDLRLWLKYAPIQVFLNHELISVKPETEKWDLVSDDAYVRLDRMDNSGLAVYNLGVHVTTLPAYRFGVSGTVVTRKQLKVNFARNDIQSDCPVWQRIAQEIDVVTSRQLAMKSKTLTDSQRRRIVDKLLSEDIAYSEVADAKLVTAVTGRHYSITDMLSHDRLSWAPHGDRKGDCAHRQGLAFVVSHATFSRFSVTTLAQFVATIERIVSRAELDVSLIDYHDLVAGLSATSTIITQSKLNKSEKVWLSVLSRLAQSDYEWRSLLGSREVVIGDSDVANAWTDSSTYIAMGRRFLAKHHFTPEGIGHVLRVFLHECCHCSPSVDEHDHDQAFYEKFHDNAHLIGNATFSVLRDFPLRIAAAKLKVNKAVNNRSAKAHAAQAAQIELTQEMREQGHV